MTDFEDICDELIVKIKSKLNTKIAAINSEKNDGITLKTIDDNAYFFQDLNEATINYNPFVFYSIQDIIGEGGFSYTPSKISMVVAIVFEDQVDDLNPSRKLFRYQRALKEIIEENFEQFGNSNKLSVQSQVPIELKLVNSSYAHRAIGVTITTDIG